MRLADRINNRLDNHLFSELDSTRDSLLKAASYLPRGTCLTSCSRTFRWLVIGIVGLSGVQVIRCVSNLAGVHAAPRNANVALLSMANTTITGDNLDVTGVASDNQVSRGRRYDIRSDVNFGRKRHLQCSIP